MPGNSTLCFRLVTEARAGAIYEFYNGNPKDFLRPRSPENLREMAEEEKLFELVDDSENVVGTCYVDPVENGPSEFGGILLNPAYRGNGLADILCLASLAVFFGSTKLVFLMAHVHEPTPRREPCSSALGSKRQAKRIPCRFTSTLTE